MGNFFATFCLLLSRLQGKTHNCRNICRAGYFPRGEMKPVAGGPVTLSITSPKPSRAAPSPQTRHLLSFRRTTCAVAVNAVYLRVHYLFACARTSACVRASISQFTVQSLSRSRARPESITGRPHGHATPGHGPADHSANHLPLPRHSRHHCAHHHHVVPPTGT
jgi:hypothetical protein